MNQKFVIITLIIAALVVGGVWYYSRPADNNTAEEKLVTEQVKDLKVQEFSLAGTITKIEEGQFKFKTGTVKDTEQGRRYVEEEKVVTFLPQTQFFMTNLNNKSSAKDLKTGQQLTVYTLQNPFERTQILASKILIEF